MTVSRSLQYFGDSLSISKTADSFPQRCESARTTLGNEIEVCKIRDGRIEVGLRHRTTRFVQQISAHAFRIAKTLGILLARDFACQSTAQSDFIREHPGVEGPDGDSQRSGQRHVRIGLSGLKFLFALSAAILVDHQNQCCKAILFRETNPGECPLDESSTFAGTQVDADVAVSHASGHKFGGLA
jgi:hypothetical protein